MKTLSLSIIALSLLASCNEAPKQEKTVSTTQRTIPSYKSISSSYTALRSKDSIKNIAKSYSGVQLNIILAVNRIDADNIVKQDSVLIPKDLSGQVIQYSPFPQSAGFLKDVDKIVFFSYPAQYFAAYEHGQLVYSGSTNMGRQKDPTPTGLFYTNWKAEETKSTFNDEWELKWNFNIQNKEGVGWHQYALPGYPASHSCLRMLESDAKAMYEWADQWVLKGTDDIQAYGTPVIVFGNYPFGSAKPWWQLLQDAHALDINEQTLQAETQSHMSDIMAKQQQRESKSSQAAQ